MVPPEQGGDWLDDMVQDLTEASKSLTDPAASPTTELATPAPAAGEPSTPVAGSAAPAGKQDPESPPPAEPAQPPKPEAAPPEAAAVPAEAPPETPFTFRNGLTVPGAMKTADGSLRVPPDRVAALERTLLSERSLQRQVADLRRQVTEVGTAKSARDAQTDALSEAFDALIQATRANPQEGVKQFLQMAENFEKHKASAEADYWRRQAETAAQQGTAAQDAQQWQAVQDEFWGALEESIAGIVQQPDYQVLKGKEAEVLAALREQPGAVFRDKADGVFKYDIEAFKRTVGQMLAIEKRVAQERAQWEQRTAVEKRNKAVLEPTKAPVTPSAQMPPAAPPTTQTGRLTKQQWRESMDDDDAFARDLQ